MQKITRQKSIFYMTRISCLAAISVILMYFEFSLPFFPSFYKLDFSTYPVIIGTFAMGPVAGLTVQLIKDLIHLVISNSSMGVGQLADFLIGISYLLPAGIIYRKIHTKKGAIAGTVTGTVSAAFFGSILNYYVFIPLFYGTDTTNQVKDLKTFIVSATLPFNLLKFGLISLLTILTYKLISPLFKFICKDHC